MILTIRIILSILAVVVPILLLYRRAFNSAPYRQDDDHPNFDRVAAGIQRGEWHDEGSRK